MMEFYTSWGGSYKRKFLDSVGFWKDELDYI